MRLKKLSLKRMVRLVVALLLCVAALDVAFETLGVPEFLVRRMEKAFSEKGMRVHLGEVRAGLINGVNIQGFEWYDGQLKDQLLFKADFVQLIPSYLDSTGDKKRSYQFEIFNGELTAPLENPDKKNHKKLNINQLNANGFIGSEGLLEVVLTGRVYSKIGIELNLLGTLPQTADTPSGEFSMVPMFPEIPPEALAAIDRLNELAENFMGTSRLQVNSKVRGDLSRLESLQMELHVNGSSLLNYGILIEQFQTSASLRPGRIELNNLRVQFAGEESLALKGEFNTRTRMINGEAEGRLFPKKFLRAFYPQAMPFLTDIAFRDVPPAFRCILRPTPIDSLSQASAELELELRDVDYLKGKIRFLQLNVGLEKQVVTARKIYAVVSPSIEIEGRAVWNIPAQTLLVNATYDGSPLALCNFCEQPDFVLGMTTAFSTSEFSEISRPHFEVEVFYSANDPMMVVSGTAAAQAFTYNGVSIDSIEASVIVDILGEMVIIDDMLISRYGAPGRAQFAIDVSKEHASLNFDAASNMDSAALMQIIQEDWAELLKSIGWNFQQTPFAQGSGYVNLIDPDDHIVEINVDAPKVSFMMVNAEDLAADLQIKWPQIKASGKIPSATVQDMSFSDATISSFLLKESGVDCLIEASKARVSDTVLSACVGELKWRTDQPLKVVNAKAESIDIGSAMGMNLNLMDIKCPLLKIHEDGKITAKGTVEEASQNLPDSNQKFLSARKLDVRNFALVDGQLLVEGGMAQFHYPALKAFAENANFRSVLKDQQVGSTITVPVLKLENGTNMNNVEVDAVTKNGRTKAGFVVKSLDKGSLKAENFSGKIEHEGEAFRISDGSCEVVNLPPFRISEVKVDALSAFDTITMRVKGGRLAVLPKTDVDRKGEKRFPLEVNKVSADMVYKNDILNITHFSGPFYGGKIRASGQMDVKNFRTDTSVVFNDIDLKKLMERGGAPGKKGKTMVGRLSATAKLEFNYKDDLTINGLGQAKIRDGSLWKLPILSDFLSLLNARVGKITKLDCDLRFQEDRMDLINVRTDGTLVSIQGSGYYWWKTEGIDMRFRADILKTWLLKNVFKKRLYGDLDDYVWEDFTPIQDLFRDNRPVDPTIRKRKVEPDKTKDSESPVPKVEPGKTTDSESPAPKVEPGKTNDSESPAPKVEPVKTNDSESLAPKAEPVKTKDSESLAPKVEPEAGEEDDSNPVEKGLSE